MIKLNPQQEDAVKHLDGPLLILAGAGSGKTRVIVNRIVHLIQQHKIQPHHILAVTFTNKAANEMKERIRAMLGYAPGLTIGTFHSICARILRKECMHLGLIESFTIIDDSEQIVRVKRAMTAAGFNVGNLVPRAVLDSISRAKNAFLTPDQYEEQAGFNIFQKQVAKIFTEYEKGLKADYSLDFDDLLIKTVNLLNDVPEVTARYQDRFRYIMVDEYQDTNSAQYQLIQRLAERYRNIMVVGDDDQSIYHWRGAEIGNILNFSKDFPGARIIKLEQNYRSSQAILSAASELMKNNSRRMEKKLWTDRKGGEKPVLASVLDERAEARYIIREIKRQKGDDGRSYKDFAVFYRINAQSRVFEEEMLAAQLPHKVMGNVGFFKRKEIKDLLSYLRLILNPFDSGACRRIINVPRRGIGRTTVQVLEEFAESKNKDLFSAIEMVDECDILQGHKKDRVSNFKSLIQDLIRISRSQTIPSFFKQLLQLSEYQAIYENLDTPEAVVSLEIIQEFENLVADYHERVGGDLKEFADYLSLHDSQEESGTTDKEKKVDRDYVSLLTLHNAKGLEFPVVFISGLEEGMCPYFRDKDEMKLQELEEERRLLYVGMTRAEERLFLCSGVERRLHGKVRHSKPSRFIREIPEEMMESQNMTVRAAPVSMNGHSQSRSDGPGVCISHPTSGAEFKPGERVLHQKLGRGIVLRCDGTGPTAKITISFDRAGQRKLLLGVCRLVKLN